VAPPGGFARFTGAGKILSNKSSKNIFTRGYNLVRTSGLLEIALFKRVFLFFYFLYKRWYEDPFRALTLRSPELFSGGDVLDIGANIGYTACVFASATRPPAKIYAFEPDLASFATLEEIILRKNLGHSVETFNAAVGSTDGAVEFWHNQEHSADHRVVTEQFKTSRPAGQQITTVAVRSVDSFVAERNLQNVSFIKIDVQGYELAVSEGMRKTLERFPELSVAFEYAPEGMRELGFEPSALLDFYRSAGYQLHVLTRTATAWAPDNRAIEMAVERSGYVDLLCSRKSLARPSR
jgi:FkbM family methyltransferase